MTDRDPRLAAALAATPSTGTLPGPFEVAGLGPLALLGRFFRLLALWDARVRERRQLEHLNDHALRDIGLHRTDVTHECNKPFWRP